MAKPTKVDLVGVGLNATDTVIPLPTYPARGSKTEYTTVSTLPGGQVATTVVACQHWGLRTRYVGKLGDDPPPPHPAALAREWIPPARALHVDGHDTEAAILAATWARAANIPVIADLDELYPNVDDLISNAASLIAS